MKNERETLTAGTRAIREIVAAFGDWARSTNTARLEELARARRSTWMADLLAARGVGAFPAFERASAIVRRLIARDLRRIENALVQRHDIEMRASALLATEPIPWDRAQREQAAELRARTQVVLAADRDVTVLRDDVAELLSLAEDIDWMIRAWASDDEAEPASGVTEAPTIELTPVERAVALLLRDGRNPRPTREYAREVGVSHSTLSRHLSWKLASGVAKLHARRGANEIPKGSKNSEGKVEALTSDLCENCRSEPGCQVLDLSGESVRVCESCAAKLV